MSTLFWKAFKASPVLLVASLFVASGASAAESNSHATAADLSTAAMNLDTEPTASISPRLDDAALTEPIPATDTPQSSVTVSPTFQLADSTFPEPVPAAGDTSVESNQEILQQIQRYGNEGSTSLDQVTSVGQLRDVSPGDWAYEALRSLVERYGCIAGYPDGTYRGNRALTRYEFAAGLNACLNQIERLIGTDGFDETELETLRRLIQEFEAELATLGARVDNLEGRVAFLEDNQFSTTTKLRGEVIFGFADTFGDTIATGDDDTNTVFGDRVRLNFETSFTGRDRLRTRLEAINMAEFNSGVTGTNMTRLGFDGADGNDVAIDELWYRFPLGDNLLVQIDAANGEFQDTILDVVNPFFDSSGSGSISRFGRFNPIYRTGGGAGGTLTYSLGDALELSASYFADEGDNPGEDSGLFNGTFAALGQITFKPTENITVAGTYVRSYYRGADFDEEGNVLEDGTVNVTGSTGSVFASQPFGDIATSADSFGIQANATFGKFSVGGWVGYQDAEAEATFFEGTDADIWNWAVNLALLDLGGEGNKLGIVFGTPPKVTDTDIVFLGEEFDDDDIDDIEDEDTSYHLEVFYRYQLTDNIAITPGAFVIFNPEHNDDNDDIWVGTIRTVFSF
ncbi:iron uptake porin [Coleofasciculus sp. E1-EBD-02]|uniref:iron uptake porin n=1 Tax=Coleofasciculus sp. E1-EBD-02 TaxID=3068481 RepID=UPI00406284D7